MSGKSPAFQFYPKDWLSDGHVREMGREGRGLYMDMLSLLWVDGSLPSDMGRLALRANIPLKRLRALWPKVSPCFVVDGENLRQSRLEEERSKQEAFREKQARNGSKGGKPKRSNGGGNPGLSSGETQNGAKESFPFATTSYLPTSGEEIEDSEDLATRHAESVNRLMATLGEASNVMGIPGADILALPTVRPPKNTPITNPAGVAVSESGIRLLDATNDKVRGLLAARRGDAIAADEKRKAQPATIFDQQARVA